MIADSVYRLPWRLLSADLVAFSHLQFSQIRGRQPYSIVRKIPYLIIRSAQTMLFLLSGVCGLGGDRDLDPFAGAGDPEDLPQLYFSATGRRAAYSSQERMAKSFTFR